MFLVIITGGNSRTGAFRIAFNSLLFICTTPAWGTLLNQMRGMISAGKDPIFFGVSPASGVFMMLMLGFGIAGLFGILTGIMFSDRKMQTWHYVLLVAFFYAVVFLFKMGPAHLIVKFVQPQSIDLFNSSLVANGVDCGVFKAYMTHFDNMDWGRTMVGGRNYVAEIGTVSLAFATFASIIFTRYVIKDRRASMIGLLTSISFAFAITAADLFFVLFCDTGKPAVIDAPRIPAWGCWEYFTGFIAGGLMTLIVVKLGTCDNRHDESADFIPENLRNLLGFAFVMTVLCYNVIRPLVLCFEKGEFRVPAVIVSILVSVIVVVVYSIKTHCNVSHIDSLRFSKLTILWLVPLQSVAYFFGDERLIGKLGCLQHFSTLISCIFIVVADCVLVFRMSRNMGEA